MDSNTIFTIANGNISVKLDKAEISILHYIEGWLPTFTDWSVEELALKCDMFAADTTAAIDMLILYGLIENGHDTDGFGRRVQVTIAGARWVQLNAETIRSINYMNNTELFVSSEIAEA